MWRCGGRDQWFLIIELNKVELSASLTCCCTAGENSSR